MRVGTITRLPNEYSDYATIRDKNGRPYSVDKGELPQGAEEGDSEPVNVSAVQNGPDGGRVKRCRRVKRKRF